MTTEKALAVVLLAATLTAQASGWVQASTTGPGARTSPALAYDSQRGRTVLFGGSGGVSFSGTWEWDGGEFLVQGAGLVPGFNQAGIVVSNAGHALIGTN